tara:strand:- start:388 stop:528 length:141 start_codon:yes stop_codon:yes gene_type:complete
MKQRNNYWGQAVNNIVGWGQNHNGIIGWGSIYTTTYAGFTLLKPTR